MATLHQRDAERDQLTGCNALARLRNTLLTTPETPLSSRPQVVKFFPRGAGSALFIT
jgi:hypothetical protein